MNYKLGILGGMGPAATCDIYNRIINHTDAKCDQDHIKMVILNNTDIPDRTKALLENGLNPLPFINESIKDLLSLGCKYYIIPCNTAHAYADKFIQDERIEFINMIKETEKELSLNYNNKKICILCTNGTRYSKVYENNNLNINYPANQDKVMSVVTNTKAGLDVLKDLQEVIKEEEDKYDVFLLACTELSLYKDKIKTKKIVLDAVDILVKASIIKCGKKYI